jgi:hypothetical protein
MLPKADNVVLTELRRRAADKVPFVPRLIRRIDKLGEILNITWVTRK